ncbi:MAG TPA: hypothetical protein VH476_10465 [Solirubrobacterales bacterium]
MERRASKRAYLTLRAASKARPFAIERRASKRAYLTLRAASRARPFAIAGASPRKLPLPLLAALALVAATAILSACGYSSEGDTSVVEGQSVTLGELKYNVVFSRYLNPADSEDSAYLVGQPPPAKGSSYFGVFLLVQNESEEAQTLAGSFTIEDSDEQRYDALPTESLYALPIGGEVEPQEQIPVLDSTPQQGPIEGSVVLFELPSSASENRPLTLEIPGPGGPAEVKIDL